MARNLQGDRVGTKARKCSGTHRPHRPTWVCSYIWGQPRPAGPSLTTRGRWIPGELWVLGLQVHSRSMAWIQRGAPRASPVQPGLNTHGGAFSTPASWSPRTCSLGLGTELLGHVSKVSVTAAFEIYVSHHHSALSSAPWSAPGRMHLLPAQPRALSPRPRAQGSSPFHSGLRCHDSPRSLPGSAQCPRLQTAGLHQRLAGRAARPGKRPHRAAKTHLDAGHKT